MAKFTGFKDDCGQDIFVGDILYSKWDYFVIVYEDRKDFYGRLICDPSDASKDIPFHLHSGKGYIKLNKRGC